MAPSPSADAALVAAPPLDAQPDAGAAPTGSGLPAGDTAAADAGPGREAREGCVDRWLASRKLDPYGHPEGTMYAGGTPLFNERTGERIERLDYVFRRHPEARQACAEAGAK